MTTAAEQPSPWLHRWVLMSGAIWIVAICGATWRFDFNDACVIAAAMLAFAYLTAAVSQHHTSAGTG